VLLDPDRLGEWSDPVAYEVTAEGLRAYAEAIGDPVPAHREGAVAPPVFAVVPGFQALAVSMRKVDFSSIGLRYLHGEQDMRFLRPIEPGMRLSSVAATQSVHRRGSGAVMLTKIHVRDDQDELLSEQYATTYFREPVIDEDMGEAPASLAVPEELLGDEVARIETAITEDQPRRYADASGDHTAYHLDEQAALEAGFPGIVLHGMCTMAHVSGHLIQELLDGDTARVRRVAVRFTKPVRPGSALTTVVRSVKDADGDWAFTTLDGAGDRVLSLGRFSGDEA
jgi:acyl dehydratase